MSKKIYLANITVITSDRTAKKQQTKIFEKVSFVEPKITYKGFRILKVEIIGILGQRKVTLQNIN